MNSLRFLNVSNCNLNELQISEQTPRLSCLIAHNNHIKTFTLASNVPQLSILDISNNPLTSLPQRLASAKNSLETLDLSGLPIDLNSIKFLYNFNKLVNVSLKNTEIDKLFPSEVEAGWQAVKALFSDFQVPFNHVKVLLLGNTNIGKSNLLYYWKNNQHNANSSNLSTHGIDYQQIKKLIKATDKQPITWVHCKLSPSCRLV